MYGNMIRLNNISWPVNKPWYKLIHCTLWSVFRMNHKEHMWESCSEICSIGVMMSRAFGCVHIHALWTVILDHGFARHITQSQRKHWLRFTIHPGTVSKVTRLILLNHLGNSSIRENVSSMNETIQHFSCLLNEIRLVGIVI